MAAGELIINATRRRRLPRVQDSADEPDAVLRLSRQGRRPVGPPAPQPLPALARKSFRLAVALNAFNKMTADKARRGVD